MPVVARPRKGKGGRRRGDHRECDARIAKLEALVEALQKTVQEQAAEIAELKRRLGQDSSNSDKPPSSDPPHRPDRRLPNK